MGETSQPSGCRLFSPFQAFSGKVHCCYEPRNRGIFSKSSPEDVRISSVSALVAKDIWRTKMGPLEETTEVQQIHRCLRDFRPWAVTSSPSQPEQEGYLEVLHVLSIHQNDTSSWPSWFCQITTNGAPSIVSVKMHMLKHCKNKRAPQTKQRTFNLILCNYVFRSFGPSFNKIMATPEYFQREGGEWQKARYLWKCMASEDLFNWCFWQPST